LNAYKLYAMPTKPETIDGMGYQRFSRITAEYTLVYTDGEAPQPSAELTDEDAGRLTEGDRNWLLACNTRLLVEEIERQKPEMLRRLGEKIEEFETILQELAEESAGRKDK